MVVLGLGNREDAPSTVFGLYRLFGLWIKEFHMNNKALCVLAACVAATRHPSETTTPPNNP